ncbi:DUF7601 domain-containing protein [Cohnella cellulosilytica]|uniref:DUF5979 domain-containing protein n=1 Tax=Cohnella cellulosilytica TaxID=986710 RepID=A0ABW2FD56_9BACL
MARKRIFTRKPIWYKSALSVCLAILLALQTVTFTASANQLDEPEFTAPESSVTEAVYDDPLAGPMFMPLAAGPTDKTAVLANANPMFNLTVKQGDPATVIPEGGEINGRDNFTLALADISVPTRGDDPDAPQETVIQLGDYAILDKASYFPDVNLTPAGPMSISQGSLKIATVQFFADAIQITFDGQGVYDGSKNSVKIGFSANAKAADQSPGGGGDTSIFGEGFKFVNSSLVPVYRIAASSQSKSGHYTWISNSAFGEGAAAWRVIAAANDKDDPSIQMKLDNLTVIDSLADAGPYVAGSFRLYKAQTTVDANGNIQQVAPPVEVPDAGEPIFDPDSGTLTYKLPDGFGSSAAYLDFKTWIPKSKWYNEFEGVNGGLVGSTSSHVALGIQATLAAENGIDTLAGPTGITAALTPDWIQQTGAIGPKDTHGNRLITWTITVNQRNTHLGDTPVEGLKDLTITDALPAGTEFVSADYTVDGVDRGEITPVNDVFDIGDTDGPVRLRIVTKVTDSNISTFTNVPRANWKLANSQGVDWNNDAVGTAPNGVTATTKIVIGAHAFTKAAETHTSYAYSLYNVAGAKWAIGLTLQYDLENPVVYDLLVHGDSLDVLDGVDEVEEDPEVTPAVLAAIKSRIDNKQLWQKYREGSLTVSNGLTGDVIPLKVKGEHVADLIKVTGYKGGVKGDVSFESVTTNPDNLFRQDSGGDWSNRALFFDGDDYEGYYDATVKNRVRMLNKEMLYASSVDENGNALGNIAADWNRSYSNWSGSMWTRQIAVDDPNLYMDNSRGDNYILAGYNRKDHTVTFRLAVNMPGYKTDEMAKDGGARVASDIKLVDTLPDGWEFMGYKLYAGVTGYNTNAGLGKQSGGGYGQYVQATAIIEPDDPKHVVSFAENGNIGTFTFSKLESPYVILLKARPTPAKMATFQLGNNPAGENQAEFSMKWGSKPYSATEKHRIIVPLKSLGKTATKPVSGVQEWTVNYTPPFEMKQGVYLLDTLAAGLKLRKDAAGGLSLAPSDIAVYPGEMKADGTLQRIGQPLDLADPNSEVKVTADTDSTTGGATLRFDFADPNKLYQIVYQTESQGMQPGTAGNSIQLMGDITLPPIEAHSSISLDANDVAGSANENGLLFLKKIGPDGITPLKDVKFQLFNPDGTPAKDKDNNVMAEKTTGADGKTDFIIQKPGDYLLKQTYIDPYTYLPTTTIYRVRVIDAPGKPVLVDGQKVDSGNPLIVPTPAQGKLTISNTVQGNGGDLDKSFEYTVTFDGADKDGTYPYKGPNGVFSTIKSGDKIFLKHGEAAELPALPAGLVYTVTQTDYTVDGGYTTSPTSRTYSGTVENNGDYKADFINERTVNKLTITNTVMGNGGDTTKEFEYTIVFEDTGKDGNYPSAILGGSTGTIKSGDSFKLKDGQTMEISGLPKDLKYTVTQKSYTLEEYVTNPANWIRTGVMEDKDEVAPFTNVRILMGGLLISNTVKGKDDDKQKKFKYTVTFTGEGADESYSYEKSDGSTGTIKSGDAFELTDDQTFIVQGLLAHLQYTVAQEDYTSDGFVTEPGSLVHTGTIPVKAASEAHFVNTRPYLEGVLRDNNTGEVIPNVKIIVTNKKTDTQQEIWTDGKGEYSIPAEADTDYTITYTKVYHVGGKDVSVPFTQKANVDSGVTDETVPADITAVGIVLFKQLDGTTEVFNDSFISDMYIYLKDKDGNYIQENGHPKAFPMASQGTFTVEGLSEQKYTMEVRYKAENGQELLFKVAPLDVKANGELNISEELVDPYGTVYDVTTGNASTGKKIKGATVTLYYADTQRNRDNGRTPNTKVSLPPVPFPFPPNENKSPEQDSDANGFYAYMVFPEADYYLIVKKSGYVTHRSDTISVDWDIVRYDVPMRPSSSGGSTPGDDGNGTDNGNPPDGENGTDNGNPPDGSGNGPDNGNPPEGSGNGTDNGNPPDGSGNGTDNGNPPDGSGNGTDNGNPPDGNDNGNPPGGNNGINARPPKDDDLDDVPQTGDGGTSSMVYTALALIALVMLRIAMPFRRKKPN